MMNQQALRWVGRALGLRPHAGSAALAASSLPAARPSRHPRAHSQRSLCLLRRSRLRASAGIPCYCMLYGPSAAGQRQALTMLSLFSCWCGIRAFLGLQAMALHSRLGAPRSQRTGPHTAFPERGRAAEEHLSDTSLAQKVSFAGRSYLLVSGLWSTSVAA